LKKPAGWSDQDWNALTKNIQQEKIFNDVLEAVYEEKQQAYDYITDSPITAAQVKSILSKTDTLIVDGVKDPVVTVTKIGPTDISLVRINEKLFFDKKKFKLEKDPVSISFFVPCLSEDGSYKGDRALFYVKLNN
jgi:hypothetical protein